MQIEKLTKNKKQKNNYGKSISKKIGNINTFTGEY